MADFTKFLPSKWGSGDKRALIVVRNFIIIINLTKTPQNKGPAPKRINIFIFHVFKLFQMF